MWNTRVEVTHEKNLSKKKIGWDQKWSQFSINPEIEMKCYATYLRSVRYFFSRMPKMGFLNNFDILNKIYQVK